VILKTTPGIGNVLAATIMLETVAKKAVESYQGDMIRIAYVDSGETDRLQMA
jgi:hypothetical protein